MDSPTPSRIDIARSRAEAAKTYLAVGAAAACGLLVLFLRAGGSTATAGTSAGTSGDDTAVASDDYDSYFFGGGEIAQPSESSSFPQAQSGTS